MKPITSWLPELSDGVMIVAQGNVEKDEDDGKFVLDFGHSKKTTAALRICVKFASQIVLSLQMAEDKGFSFQRQFIRTGVLRFEVIVLVSDGNFKISLNGCHVCEAPYLFPLNEINRLEVNGNVLLHKIFCQRPCYTDQQVNGDDEASKKAPDMVDETKRLAGSATHKSDPEKNGGKSEPSSVDASDKTKNPSKSEKCKDIRKPDVSEADDLSNQLSDTDLSDGCLSLGLSTGDTPESGSDALEAACWSMQPGSCAESEAPETLTNTDQFELPYAFLSPQAPTTPVPSAEPEQNPPTGIVVAQNPLVPNCPDASYPTPQFTQSQNPKMLAPSSAHSAYPGPMPMPNQDAVIRGGTSNAPYPCAGYAYQQNPVHPGQWNAPYPMPSNASSAPYPVPSNASSQHHPVPSTGPLPAPHPSQGYTPKLYPPLPSDSAAPFLFSVHDAQRPNPAMSSSSYGTHPAVNPSYCYSASAWPNYNQQPVTDAMRNPNWTHSNMKYIPEGLRLNQVINIYGGFLQNSSGFSVWMANGETEDADIFLNMVVSFPDRMVSRNRKIYNRWSQMENSLSHFPFQVGKPFQVAIVCCYNLFRVYGNTAHLFDFHVTANLSGVTSVKIFGMVTAVNITVN